MSACTFFGHRECHSLDPVALRNTIGDLINNGVDTFYVGHQGNFDGMVYSCLKQLRKVYPHIQVSVVLAYLPTQITEGKDMSNTMYPEIEGQPRFAIERRNKWMIGASDFCLCYINHPWGGAYKFARIAKCRGLQLINLGTVEL